MIKPTIYDFKDKIEFTLLGLVIIPVLFKVLLFSGDISIGLVLTKISLAALCALSILYVYISDKQLVFLAAIGLFGVAALLRIIGMINIPLLFSLPFIVAAIALGLLCWKHSKEYNDFELIECLLAIFLLITASGSMIDLGFSQYYSFGICFLVATLMYNNNLWARYKSSERNLLVLLLVYGFAEVVEVSAKYISF